MQSGQNHLPKKLRRLWLSPQDPLSLRPSRQGPSEMDGTGWPAKSLPARKFSDSIGQSALAFWDYVPGYLLSQ